MSPKTFLPETRALRILQYTVDKIHSLGSLFKEGLRISTQKTKFIIIQKPRIELVTLSHPLVIANNTIPQVDTVKVLGLLSHFRHSWLPHIGVAEAKCLRALNIFEILSHPTHECNRNRLVDILQKVFHFSTST